jgi:hypothetical protein
MIDQDDDSHIDKSQWREWSAENPLVTPEREAKGDMKIEYFEDSSEIKFAQAQVRNIINFLWEREIITTEQHAAGQTFWAWRNQHRVAMGQQRSITDGTPPESFGVKLRAYGYVLLLKRLSTPDYNAIDQSIETFETEHWRYFALRDAAIYRRAFIRLADILPAIKDRIAYLEGLAEDERQFLSDEALKNFLAAIVKFV